jgi:hypothetical protein
MGVTMERVYRVKRGYLYQGLGGVIVCSALLCTVVPLAFLDKTCPPQMPYGMAAILAFFLGISVLLTLCTRQQLRISDKGVTLKGVFRERTIDFDGLAEVHWGFHGHMSQFVLRSPDARVVVSLMDYSRDESSELIRFFRFRVRQDIQQNWDTFWNFNWPQFDEPDASDEEANRDATRKMRLRMFYLLLGGSLLVALCGFFVWRYLHRTAGISEIGKELGRILGSALVLLVFGAWLISSISVRVGRVRKMIPHEEKGEGLMKTGIAGFFLAMPACLGFYLWLGIFNIHTTTGLIVCMTTMLGFGAIMFVGMHKHVKARKGWLAEAAKLAEESYMKPPDDVTKG